MTYHIYSNHSAKFGPDASGGSEQYHIELCKRLVGLGHNVISYAPCDPCWRDGVRWVPVEQADPTAPGIWIIQRTPAFVFQFPDPHPYQSLIFAAHDFDYDAVIHGVKWADRFDAILAESEVHGDYLRSKYPHSRVVVTGAGFPMERADEALAGVVRNSKRIIHTSNPTRGLVNLLKIFKRAYEDDQELELAITYGWDYIDHLIDTNQMAGRMRKFKAEIARLADQPGVTWLGRLPTTFDVWREMAQSGIYCYPTSYNECFCNSVAEAQTFGAIPVVSPGWAIGENTHHGVILFGNPDDDRLVRARFVRELVALANRPDLQEKMRAEMMPDARQRFGFQDTVNRIDTICTDLWSAKQGMVVGA